MSRFLTNLKNDIKNTYYKGKYITMTLIIINIITYLFIMANIVFLKNSDIDLIFLIWLFIGGEMGIICDKYWHNKNEK